MAKEYCVKVRRTCGVASRCTKCGEIYSGIFVEENKYSYSGDECKQPEVELEKTAVENMVRSTGALMRSVNTKIDDQNVEEYSRLLEKLGERRCEACGHTLEWSEWNRRQSLSASPDTVTRTVIPVAIVLAIMSLIFMVLSFVYGSGQNEPVFIVATLLFAVSVTGLICWKKRKEKGKLEWYRAEMNSLTAPDQLPLIYDGNDIEGFRAEFPNDERARALRSMREIGENVCSAVWKY